MAPEARLIMLGAGGHARVLCEALRAGGLKLGGYVTNEGGQASGVMSGTEYLGTDDDLIARGPDGVLLVNGIGSVGRPEGRRHAFDRYRAAGFRFSSVVHPRAVVALDVLFGEGVQVMAGVVLQSGVQIGSNAIVNTGAVVDHDTHIGDHVHIAPRACLAADVIVENSVHVGAGATVVQGRRIGAGTIVGAGAVVVDDIPERITVVGVPARPMTPA